MVILLKFYYMATNLMKKILKPIISIAILSLSIYVFLFYVSNAELRIPIALSALLVLLLAVNLFFKRFFIRIPLVLMILFSLFYAIMPFKIEMADTRDELDYFKNDEQKIIIVPVFYGTVLRKNSSKILEKKVVFGGGVTHAPFDIKYVVFRRGDREFIFD